MLANRISTIVNRKWTIRKLNLSAQTKNIYFGKTRTPDGIAYGRNQAQKMQDIFENEIEEKIYKDAMKANDRPVSFIPFILFEPV